jgi:hypothetical protein
MVLGDIIRRACEEERLKRLFQHMSRDELRALWDAFNEEGPYDMTDLHTWMNLQGDGEYCAV